MDPRLTPANGRVAHVSLRGQVLAERYSEGEAAEVASPLTDLCRDPGGARARQLLMGDAFTVLERRDGWAFGQATRDGHAGWLEETALQAPTGPTHWVCAPATHLYPAPDIKSREVAALSLGARLHVVEESGQMARTAAGYHVPRPHLCRLGEWASDPVAVAESLLGTPYLWGGNSRAGTDCSGLVQISLLACGRPCPPDSDLQMALGAPLSPEAGLRRGDLVFWRGHVGWMTSPTCLLHANAFHMAVAMEPLAGAQARIAGSGGGPILAFRRLLP